MKTIALILFSCLSVGALANAAELLYPYHATSERRTAILRGATEIRIGMTAKQAEAIFGAPDEKHDTFDRIKAAQAHKTGYSYVYLLQRLHAEGSVAQKDEKSVRLHFDFDDRLKQIDDETK